MPGDVPAGSGMARQSIKIKAVLFRASPRGDGTNGAQREPLGHPVAAPN